MRTRVVPTVAAIAALAMLAGCGGSGSSQSTPETEAASTAPALPTTPSTAQTEPEPRSTTVTIRVVGGKPEGGIARPSLEQGEHVVLVVRSDVADEVHLHGYDIARAVAAGGSARITFVARIPGRFELELEGSGVQLAELTVR